MPPAIYEADYRIGQPVFLRLRADRTPGMVTGVLFRPSGVSYFISWPSAAETSHYAIELAPEFVPDYAARATGDED